MFEAATGMWIIYVQILFALSIPIITALLFVCGGTFKHRRDPFLR